MNKEEQFILEKISDAAGTAEVSLVTNAVLIDLLVKKGVLTHEDVLYIGGNVLNQVGKEKK